MLTFIIGSSSATGGATAASGRQRRMGHSGPPTGDFQLHSDPGSDDEEDDPDEELMRAREREHRQRYVPFAAKSYLHIVTRCRLKSWSV